MYTAQSLSSGAFHPEIQGVTGYTVECTLPSPSLVEHSILKYKGVRGYKMEQSILKYKGVRGYTVQCTLPSPSLVEQLNLCAMIVIQSGGVDYTDGRCTYYY